MDRYLGHPAKRQNETIWLKPHSLNNNWLHGAVGRFASFGQRAVTGFWDEVNQEFKVAWCPEAQRAAEKYWPQAWMDAYGF